MATAAPTAAPVSVDGAADVGGRRRTDRWPTLGFGPLDGRVRFAFFTLVLAVGARFFAVTVPASVRSVPAELYDGAGLFGLLVDDRATALALVDVLRWPLLLALVLSAVGLGGRWPMLVAGIASFLMVGAHLSGTGGGHAWYVPVAALVALGLTHRPSTWSLDGVIARHRPGFPFGRSDGDHSATGRAAVLVVAVATLVAGGLAKLLEAGWRWMDGASLRTYLVEQGAPKGPLGRWLTDLVVDHQWVAATLSTATILVELAAVVTLLVPSTRLVYFALLACGFHAATTLLMVPDFAPQAVAYLLVIEWTRVDWRRPWRLHPPPVDPVRPRRPARSSLLAALVLAAGFTAVVVGRVEWYPVSSIPMYRSYVDADEISGLPTATFGDPDLLCARADELGPSRRPWYAPFHLADRLLLTVDGGPPRPVESVTAGTPQGGRFWADELAEAVLDDLPCAGGDLTGTGVAAAERALGALLAPLGAGQVELVHRFDDASTVVLAAARGPAT